MLPMFDRRNKQMCLMKLALAAFLFTWGLLGIALAQGSLNEHSSEINIGLWLTVLGLWGIVQSLLVYIYITGQKSAKEQQRIMMGMITEMKKSFDKRDEMLIELHTEHKMIMHKCAAMHISHKDAED